MHRFLKQAACGTCLAVGVAGCGGGDRPGLDDPIAGAGSDGGSGDHPADGGDGGDGSGGLPPDDPLPPPLRSITVDTVPELRDALDGAEPGDLILLRDQVWELTSEVDVTRSGTAGHPIVISAETIGGAVIEGSAGLALSDVAHVVVRGLDFRFAASGVGIDCDDCSHVRFTRNRFELDPDGDAHWFRLVGDSHHNLIDRNAFANKATEGNMFTFDGTDDAVASFNRIELNHFSDHTFDGENGGECMRVGWSGLKYARGENLIQYNLFERCNGDPEIVSNKSSNNTFRYNTFRDNDGALVFRHGHGSRAIGNFFLGNEGGIRVYGDDHLIVNNYLAHNTGGGGTRSTIAIGSGTELDEPASGAGYDAAERVLIAFNTLLDNASHIGIGTDDDHDVGAIDCTIANNLLVGDDGSFADRVRGYTGFTWEGNLLSGSADTGAFPDDGHTRTGDPMLVEGRDSIARLAAGSPAIDAAAGSYPDLADDVDGHARAGALDIGADEHSTAPPRRRPLLPADVGPAAP
jgi:poly(beta-D-mannuronate) lyase